MVIGTATLAPAPGISLCLILDAVKVQRPPAAAGSVARCGAASRNVREPPATVHRGESVIRIVAPRGKTAKGRLNRAKRIPRSESGAIPRTASLRLSGSRTLRARVNDRSLGQPGRVASESHTRCIRHVPYRAAAVCRLNAIRLIFLTTPRSPLTPRSSDPPLWYSSWGSN